MHRGRGARGRVIATENLVTAADTRALFDRDLKNKIKIAGVGGGRRVRG